MKCAICNESYFIYGFTTFAGKTKKVICKPCVKAIVQVDEKTNLWAKA